MKRFTITVALAVMMTMPMFAEHVDPETARKVATTFLNNNGAKATQLTDLSKEAGFPNLYFFSTENGAVIMAADDRVKPILGYSLTDKFIVKDMPENLRWWLQGYNDEIQFAIDNSIESSKRINQEWNGLKNGTLKNEKATPVVAPLTTTEWGQGSKDNPYWYCCPKSGDPGQYTYAKAGCVAVSMAQVMKYHNHPAQGSGSHSYQSNTYGTISADFGATTYDWNNMPATVSKNSSTTIKLAVGTLIFHCGVAVNMDYGPQASGADHADVPLALTTYFNYSSSVSRIWREDYTDSQWITILKNELDASRPLIYGGANQNYVAHSFVCDGYNSDNYFHFNWGWEGSYHGFYYSIDNLDPKYTGGAYCYNYYQDAIIGIKPASGETPAAPTGLHCNIIGNDAMLNWNAPDNGTYTYKVFRNGTKIAEGLNSTTYTDYSLTDNTLYYYSVRAFANDEESDNSNISYIVLGNISTNDLVLEGEDNMIITENSILTVSGTLSNDNEEHLILENGAQLIHNSNGVKATVKKSIAPYTADDNGWYFIASPVLEDISPSTANSLLNGVYDLYYYDEPTHYWMNYRSNAFDLAYKQGYLYASNANTPLQFAGTLAPSNSSVNVDSLSYNSTILKGFNLVGNPFACNATIDQDCYIIDNNQGIVVLAEQTPIIAPCEGVFVKATASNNSVTFTKSTGSKVTKASDCLDLVITQGRSTADRARVRFGEGIGMEKYTMDDKHSQISLLQNGQDFAVAYANEENEIPLNFKAAKDDIYTLSVETEDLELNYLHLIDNLTGNDVDLLALRQARGPAGYTFEAKTTDYASRFKLVFDNNDGPSTSSGTFAYISDGNIVINNTGEATLQIVDMMGRVVVEGDATNRVSTNGMTPGVYVLRLINGEEVHTQKIVIE